MCLPIPLCCPMALTYKTIHNNAYVTGYGKTAHFAQYFKIELLVLKGRVALKAIISGNFFIVEVTRCVVLAVSVQSFLSYRFKPNWRNR